MIYILSGNIRTGKTTALLEWSKNRDDVDGILCPDNEFGKRYFLEIKSKKTFPLEIESNSSINSQNITRIGSFHFLKSAFEKSNDYLMQISKKGESKYVIIDELGKLELKNEGLHKSASHLISSLETNQNHHLILVVRSSLLDEIITHYDISDFLIMQLEDLIDLN